MSELVDILLDSREWQTFDCKRAEIKPIKIVETVNKGLIEKVETGYRGNTYYKKPGVEIPSNDDDSFAGGDANDEA